MGNAKGETEKAYRLRLSQNALHNIDEITGYIGFIKQQPINAIRVGDKIFDTIERIQKNPLAFRECEEIPTKTKTYRKAVCMSWLIIFKVKACEITILGIIHGSRRPTEIKRLRRQK